jgi:hypothetical protein
MATSQSTRLSKDYSQVAGYNPAKDAGQVIGFSHSTDVTASHPTKQPKDGCQVVGYRPPAEELLAGHPKDGSQVAGYKPQPESRWLSHPAPRPPPGGRVYGGILPTGAKGEGDSLRLLRAWEVGTTGTQLAPCIRYIWN